MRLRLLILSSFFFVFSVIMVAAQEDETVVVFGWEQEAQNLQPLNGLTYSFLLENFYARDLWDWDANRDIFPVMAAEIPTRENGMVEITEDGNTAVTVQLREGLMWSDGTPITTADCEVWHQIRSDRSTTPSVTRATYPELVSSFEIIDDTTFVITYNGTFPDYLGATERPSCRYPGHIFGPMIEDGGQLDDSAYFVADQEVVGYGPYKLQEWNIGENMIFVKNEYWDLEEPAIDRIVVQFIPDDAQMRNSLETGEIDVAFGWSDDLQPLYAAIPGVETFSTISVNNDALWMRTGPLGSSPEHGGDALEDPLVRQAIVHAIDRRTLAEELVAPGIDVPTNWYPPNMWPDDLPFLEYDVERANELLDEAGWIMNEETGIREKDGVTLDNLRLVTTENTLRNNYQLVIQEYLAEVGIGVDVGIVPAGVLFAGFSDRGTLATYEWDMTIFFAENLPFSPSINPSSYACGNWPSAESPSTFNVWQFCDPRWEEVNEEIKTTFPGPERDALIEEAVRRHFEGYFWHGLRVRATWFAVDTTLLDFDTVRADVGNLSGNWFNNIENWEFAGDA